MKRIVVITLIAFILGWLFPVEGPVDFVYDDYVAHKVATKNGPTIKEEKPLINEFDFDEWYEDFMSNYFGKREE